MSEQALPYVTDQELDYNFDKLVDTPEGMAAVNRILKAERTKMNTMSLVEFHKYEPLFRYSGMDEIGVAQFRELATEYYHRISIYDPVTVIDMDQRKVAFILPPIFNRYNPIGLAGRLGNDINQAFINVSLNDDPMSMKKLDQYAEYYKRLIHIVNDSDEQQKKIETANRQKEEALQAIAERNRHNSQNTPEIRQLDNANFKDGEIITLSDDNEEDNDGYQVL